MSHANQPIKQKRPISGSAIVRIVLWSLVLAILLGLFALFMIQAILGDRGWDLNLGLHFGAGGFRYDDDAYTVGGGSTQTAITEIDVDWLDGEVNILPSDGESVEIKEDYNGEDADYRLRWRVENGQLSVKHQAPYWLFGILGGSHPTKNLTILVPTAMLENMDEVSVESVEADVTYTGNARALSLDAVEGSLTVTGTIGDLDMDSVDGDLTFRGSLERLDMDGVEGSAVLYLDQAGDINVDGVEARVTLHLGEAITGFRLTCDGIGSRTQVEGFEDIRRDGNNISWGDESLTIDVDGVSPSVTVERMDTPTAPETPAESDTTLAESDTAPAESETAPVA